MSRKGIPAVWRDAVRDSELDRTAKAVGWCLSTWMNGGGYCFPEIATIAKGASMTDRAAGLAITRLEVAGFLIIERSKGRTSHRYQANLPATANAVRCSEWATAWATAKAAPSNTERRRTNTERRSHESVESAESGALAASHALKGGAARALSEDECGRCGERKVLVDDVYCSECIAARTGAML